MGQIVSSAAKPKRCNLNKLSQLGTPAAGEHILVSYDNSMTANGQGNFDRYIMGDGRTAATALELKYLDDSTRPYIVEEVNKAVADIQPIEITGDVTNAPDEEDLTSENQGGTDVLKFKDKAYNAALYSGLGRVYLRKNIVTLEGTGKNVLTQAMVNTANTIYHIQYDYDLNGQTITLPEGCVLEFDGGSVKNGTLAGTILNKTIQSEWFGDFDTFLRSCSNLSGFSEIKVKSGSYNANVGMSIEHDVDIDFADSSIHVDKSVGTFLTLGTTSSPIELARLSAAAKKSDRYISVTSVEGIIGGDILILKDDTDYSYSNFRNYKQGEIIVVDYISDNKIYLASPLYGDYIADNIANCMVLKPSFCKCSVKNLAIDFDKEQDTTECWMLQGNYLVNSTFTNISAKNFDISIEINKSYNCELKRLDVFSSEYTTYNDRTLNQYGVSVSNSQNIKVFDVVGACGNHVFSVTGTEIVSRNILFDNVNGKGKHSNYYGINTHGGAEYITISNSKVTGIDLGGNHIIINNCSVYPNNIADDTQNYAVSLNEITGYDITIADCFLIGRIHNRNNVVPVTNITLEAKEKFTISHSKWIIPSSCSIINRTTFANDVDVVIENCYISTQEGAANLTNITLSNEHFSWMIKNNVITNIGFIAYATKEIFIENNNIYLSSGFSALRVNTIGSGESITIKNNYIDSSSTQQALYVANTSPALSYLEIKDNHIIARNNNAGINIVNKASVLKLIFKGNITDCTGAYLTIKAGTIYTDITPELGIIHHISMEFDKVFAGNQLVGSSNQTIVYQGQSPNANYYVAGRLYGTTAQRPTNPSKGFRYMDTDLNMVIEWNGAYWTEYDGVLVGASRSGSTASRPTGQLIKVGFMYMDTDLGKPIYAKAISGTSVTWVDATGTAV